MIFTSRFAPSPTGPLHLGHAYSALLAFDLARAAQGRFLLRIDDIDQSRARPEWEQLIYDDLTWLGVTWDGPVRCQSNHMPAYMGALDRLWERGLLYPCTCNRRDIAAAASAPQEGVPLMGPDGLVYPGTCRIKPKDPCAPRPTDVPLRLDLHAASLALPDKIRFLEMGNEMEQPFEALYQNTGDVVLSRRDMGTSYHLSVVVDDAAQDITDVVRGADLLDATAIHVVLQQLLDLPTPRYHHHRLIRDDTGKRLAKRDDARAISKFRSDGATPADIRQMVGLSG